MNRHRILVVASALILSVSGLMSAAGRSEVADAVMKGDRTALGALLQRKADVNAPQADGATALHWAVYRDDLDAADLLIRAGATLDAANPEGITPLAMACLYGNVSMINKLVKAGADAKQRGPNGQTLLMLAARNGQPEAIAVLVAAGADLNAKESLRGTTALMWAAEQKHPAAVKALLDGGADVAAKRVQPVCRETTWRVVSTPPPFKRRCDGGRPQRPRAEPTNSSLISRVSTAGLAPRAAQERPRHRQPGAVAHKVAVVGRPAAALPRTTHHRRPPQRPPQRLPRHPARHRRRKRRGLTTARSSSRGWSGQAAAV